MKHLFIYICGFWICALPALAFEQLHFDLRDNLDMTEAVRAASLLATLDPKTTPTDEVLAAARADYARIVAALFDRGYYGPAVSITLDGREAALVPALETLRKIGEIRVSVTAGALYHFGKAQMAPLPDGMDNPFQLGAPAPATLFQTALDSAIAGWRARGHAKAALADEAITADHQTAQIRAQLRIDPGPVLRFGDVQLEGQRKMKPARILAIAGLPVGARFSPDALEKSALRLRRSGAFASVALHEAEQPSPDDRLPITITMAEEKPRHIQIGAEASSTDGGDVTAQWMHRNLFGGAERLSFKAGVTHLTDKKETRDYTLDLGFERPATFGPDTLLRLKSSYARRNDAAYNSDEYVLGLGFTQAFAPKVSGTADFAYAHSAGKDSAGAPFQHTALTLPIGAIWENRDQPRDPARGAYLSAEVKPFLGIAGGTGNGVRLYSDMRGYQHITRFVLAGRVQVGAVLGAKPLQTPRSDLFFAGGGGSVRGLAFQSLGVTVTDDSGAAHHIGGNRLSIVSAELRAPLFDNWGAVGFVDAARVDLNHFVSKLGAWRAGAGLGLRYKTPVGPVRFDIAVPVHQALALRNLHFYIGLGQAF